MRDARSGDVFSVEVVDERPGLIICRLSGPHVLSLFTDESGGHRWQRVSPTEKRGRVHSSTITVAVLPEPTEAEIQIRDRDLDWTTTRGSGPGGQHRNKTESAVLLKHLPTGTVVRCESERSQYQNKQSALAVLRARLYAHQQQAIHAVRATDRKAQVGSGMRGDKRRTVRVRDGQVHDHLTGRRWELAGYLRGEW